jgi:hypothetical protein
MICLLILVINGKLPGLWNKISLMQIKNFYSSLTIRNFIFHTTPPEFILRYPILLQVSYQQPREKKKSEIRPDIVWFDE